MDPYSNTWNYERKTPGTRQLVIGFIVLAIGAFWVIQAMRKGSFTANPSGVSRTGTGAGGIERKAAGSSLRR